MRVVRFLDSIKDKADVIYLLGDILDYWFEYRTVVPRGFVRFFGKIAELTDRGVRVVWFIGNHDIWIFDYLPSELGIEVVDGSLTETIDGRRFYLTHGDGVGKLKPSFKLIRTLFRNRTAQKLFSGIHPRWTVPFAYNWSRHSRKTGGSGYDPSRMIQNFRDFSLRYLRLHPDINYFIFGHLHVVSEERLTDTAQLIVLGDWISNFSYAVWDGTELSMSRWKD